MKTSLLNTIKKNIPKKSTVILAFSGGPDSVYLFHMLKKASIKHPFKIILAHLNHKIRGKDSDMDEKFCRLFAKKNNLEIEIGRKNILLEKGNIEENARKRRYEFLFNKAKKHKAQLVITAHHLDDNIETFLMNFLRGTGLKGLSGIQKKSANLFRPLLETSKEEILNYLKKHSIKFRTDKTNFDSEYTRNNIRKNVIPTLRKIQPALNEVFTRNLETLSQTQEFIDYQAEKWIKENTENLPLISIKKFKREDFFMQKIILKRLFNLYHKTNEGLTKEMIQRAQKIINNGKTGKKTSFGNKTYIVLNNENFEIIEQKTGKPISRKKLIIPGKTEHTYGAICAALCNKIPNNLSKGIYIDYSKCNFPLYVRGKKNGDKFIKIGMEGQQKLQDFLVNKKIPQQNRKMIPIIVDKNDKIIAIGSFSISDAHKVTKSTKKIISLSFKASLENKRK